ncbi:FHA domain-containing protein [Clostridium fermenticellae]|uniref:FHA domain-containing protein n=1 Tax=Clostridium fermenticellae TaxID=2068654 RepID=A0A386H114_9CLOT|nr:FHA domain-containing protein [Clostridium fermenticellae]AYD39387.1 FHA domain-containing protein [Clostridium fermenticellae]
MDLSSLSLIFKIVIIAIIYIIIMVALRIMYKDIKNGGRKSKRLTRRSFGLEIVNPGNNNNLRKGAVIPIRGEISIGRKSNNLLVLDDPYASGYHARVYSRNNAHILEDLHSTNGTLLNGTKVTGKTYIKAGDEVRIGNTSFKVIG